jgi:hypothetical protein
VNIIHGDHISHSRSIIADIPTSSETQNKKERKKILHDPEAWTIR